MYCYKANKQWTNYGKVPLPPGINSTLLFNLWSHRSVSGNPFQRVPQPSAWQKSGSVSFCGSSEPELNVFSSPLPANTPTELHSLPRSQCHSSVTGGWKQSCCLWYHVPTQGKVPAPVPQEEPKWRITKPWRTLQLQQWDSAARTSFQTPSLFHVLQKDYCTEVRPCQILLSHPNMQSSVKAESFVFLQTCRDSAHVSFLLCIIEKV